MDDTVILSLAIYISLEYTQVQLLLIEPVKAPKENYLNLSVFYSMQSTISNLVQEKTEKIWIKIASIKKDIKVAKDAGKSYVNVEGTIILVEEPQNIFDITRKRFFAAVGFHNFKKNFGVRSSLSMLFDLSACNL